jgi:hypothetical protein
MLTHHSINPKHQARLSAFGWGRDDLARVSRQLPQGLDGVALVLASRPKPVKAGGATGRHLVGIIRGGKLITVVLTDNLSPAKHRVKVVVH